MCSEATTGGGRRPCAIGGSSTSGEDEHESRIYEQKSRIDEQKSGGDEREIRCYRRKHEPAVENVASPEDRSTDHGTSQGILKWEVSLYHPPTGLIFWKQLYDN